MKIRKKYKENLSTLAFALAGVLVVSLSTIAILSMSSSGSRKTNNVESISVAPEPDVSKIDSTILFTGNVYLSRYINDWAMASPLKYAYPFSRLNEFGRENYNAWIGGLECPTVVGVQLTSAEEDATLTFNCSPDYLPELAKWFNIMTLANNHTDNQGEDGFKETKTRLDENNIQYFGHYDPRVTEDACEVVAMPVTVSLSDGKTKQGDIPFALCGYVGVFRIPPQDSIDQITKYSALLPVISMPHMGKEYVATPDQIKTSVYRSMIDAGADAVIGDHPHWIQTSESYNGKLIVYSMGNFIFDQQDTAEVTRSAAIKVIINSTGQGSETLQKWLDIGANCKKFKDNCYQQIVDSGLEKLSLSFQFSVVGTNDADKMVKPATESQTNSILQRLNWDITIKGLTAPYSGS